MEKDYPTSVWIIEPEQGWNEAKTKYNMADRRKRRWWPGVRRREDGRSREHWRDERCFRNSMKMHDD